MTEPNTWQSICIDAGDGSGDLLIEIPPGLLAKQGWTVGQAFDLQVRDGHILMIPIATDEMKDE